jgi:hypothetical protein
VAFHYSGSSSGSAGLSSEAPAFGAFAGVTPFFFTGAAREQLAQVAGLADPDDAEVGALLFLACAARPATRYFLIFSSLFGPIPRTDSRSSTLLNAPYDFLICKILSAVAGPIPGTSCSCAEFAELISIGWPGGFFVAEKHAAAAAS